MPENFSVKSIVERRDFQSSKADQLVIERLTRHSHEYRPSKKFFEEQCRIGTADLMTERVKRPVKSANSELPRDLALGSTNNFCFVLPIGVLTNCANISE